MIIVVLISFGFGIVAGYLLHGYPPFESILKWVIGGLSFAVVIELGGLLREWFKERSEEQAKLNEKMTAHSKLLYTTLQTLTNKLDFSDGLFNSPILFGKYSIEVASHLESGYLKEVCNHKKDRDSLISTYNSLFENFSKSIIKEIDSEIKQKFPSLIEWYGKGQTPMKYFVLEYLSSDIKNSILASYRRTYEISKWCCIKHENNKWKVFISHTFAESDNETEAQEIKQIIVTVFDNALIKENFKNLKNYYENVVNKQELFVNAVDVILKNIENDIPLIGKCEICENF